MKIKTAHLRNENKLSAEKNAYVGVHKLGHDVKFWSEKKTKGEVFEVFSIYFVYITSPNQTVGFVGEMLSTMRQKSVVIKMIDFFTM